MWIKQNWSSLNQWATCIWKVEGKAAKIYENIVKEISIKELEGFKFVATAKDFYPNIVPHKERREALEPKEIFIKVIVSYKNILMKSVLDKFLFRK